jgi:WD40 repeat protein
VLSWSADYTLRVWDTTRGTIIYTFENKSHVWVWGAMELSDRQILTWSDDVKLWRLPGFHLVSGFGPAAAVSVSRRSQVSLAEYREPLSCQMAGFCFGPFRPIERSSSLYIWDRESESASIVLEGHGNWINGASEIGNERIVSWSDDGTIRLWSSTTGDCLKVLKGHKGRVESVIADRRSADSVVL